MDLDDLCKKLIEHGLLDMESFSPRFTERIMREGGGVEVLDNQSANIIANIKTTQGGTARCIEQYPPEIVELYFTLQELADHVRINFYKDAEKGQSKNAGKNEIPMRRLTDEDRSRIIEAVKGLRPGQYKSAEIGELTGLGLGASSIGKVLSHLSEDERKQHKLKYIPANRTWEKYQS